MTARPRITADGVNAATAHSLRTAMQRLFAGRPERTDGRLTKENLWREAQTSRATMNRARAILAEWDAHLAEHGKTTPGEGRRDAEISRLRGKLADKTAQCTLFENRLKAAATAIAALHHDNQALRAELADRNSRTVSPIQSRR